MTQKSINKPIQPLFYAFKVPYSNSVELLQSTITLYSTIENIKSNRGEREGANSKYLRTRLVEALTYYVWKGYSKETKRQIREALSINATNLNQINAELTSKNYLVKDKYNTRVKHLSEDLQELRKYFLDEDYSHSPLMIIKFLDATKTK